MLTQEQLADRVGLNQQTVWRHEHGKLAIRDKARQRYAEALNISVIWLQHGIGSGPTVDASRLIAAYLESDFGRGTHPEVVELLRRFPYGTLGLTHVGLRVVDDLRRIMEMNRGSVGHSAHATPARPERQPSLFDDHAQSA